MKTHFMGLSLALLLGTSPLAAKDLVVHEWGTFTSFMGSNGAQMDGMHTEDEPLPGFVYGLKKEAEKSGLVNPLNYDDCRSKLPCDIFGRLGGAQAPNLLPENPVNAGVTQKMETPVIYFYGKTGQKVKVDIGFPEGIITQYYPKATARSPKLDQVKTLGPSQFTFEVELKDVDYVGNIPTTTPESIWNPAREVAANTIQVDDENEKFIFYRGVGDFKSNLVVTSQKGNFLKLTNTSSEIVPRAFILNSNGTFGNIETVKNISSSKLAKIPTAEEGMKFPTYIKSAKAIIVKALRASGLYEDEAVAMVNTWERSYFHTPGVRVLYIVPRSETERILPLSVTPAPKELVRTLVGRVEVMTHDQELGYLELLREKNVLNPESAFGRFHEPKLRRLREIAVANREFDIVRKIDSLL